DEPPGARLRPREERGHGRLGQVTDAGQVDVDHHVPHRVGRGPRRVAAGDAAGDGQGGVDAAESLDGYRHRPLQRGAVADVSDDADRVLGTARLDHAVEV